MFADFQGYSLIAIGVSLLFGYRLNLNFNYPFAAQSFREFWTRWHISLSSFLMEYLYIPLGGNRKGKLRTYVNLIVTMSLGGLWHGASWGYLIWGMGHGLLLACERLVLDKKRKTLFPGYGIFVFLGFAVLLLLFKIHTFEQRLDFWHCMACNVHIGFQNNWSYCLFIIPVVVYYVRHAFVGKCLIFSPRYDFVYYGFMLLLILENSGSTGAFIYFQF